MPINQYTKQINELYDIFKNNKKISIDSRTIKKNEIFWALKGENFDGNKFVNDAIKSGAQIAVTSDFKYIKTEKCLYVPDTLKLLQKFANYHRRKLNIPIIAVTGTNGKTTTKELITAVLKKKYNVGSTKGNFNNHIGAPLTLLSFGEEINIGVVEIGANHPDEIRELCEIVEPNFGIITNISKAHLEGFGSLETIIKTKNELYQAIRKENGVVFINNDNKILKKLATKIKKVKYGKTNDSTYVGKLIKISPFIEVSVKIDTHNVIIIKSKLFGSYNLENILVAVSVGNYFDVKSEDIKNAIENYIPSNNRSQITKINKTNIVLDAYNANPTSMKLAIENFYLINSKKKIFILGDMLELGNETLNEHKEIINLLNNKNKKDKFPVFLVGKYFTEALKYTKSNENIKCFGNTKILSKHISDFDFKENFILLKASRGIKLETIIDIF